MYSNAWISKDVVVPHEQCRQDTETKNGNGNAKEPCQILLLIYLSIHCSSSPSLFCYLILTRNKDVHTPQTCYKVHGDHDTSEGGKFR